MRYGEKESCLYETPVLFKRLVLMWRLRQRHLKRIRKMIDRKETIEYKLIERRQLDIS